jgi:hypothetical protein
MGGMGWGWRWRGEMGIQGDNCWRGGVLGREREGERGRERERERERESARRSSALVLLSAGAV